ncbi:MAG: 30S ribosomal protein S12 methylthiotransferase RimO [Bacteroidaceae bacterium]|nr:30S ribosomal protein S12 methylthiotransferase RimO [Bacteroidaceae bacterium]
MRRGSVDIITLGCSKNLVDSERLIAQFRANGLKVRHDPDRVNAETVVINTCGFIADAQEESIRMILECGQLRKEGKIGRLFVMGCLSQKFRRELEAEIPEVDGWYGKFDWNALLKDTGHVWNGEMENERCLTTPPHYAYLKIAEGCNRGCAYCAIPLMTGPYRSRSMDDILDETHRLLRKGVKEIQLIAQDLTFYGRDTYGKPMIADLVSRMSDMKGLEWLRLHYGYPDQFPLDILPVMRERDNVCRYLDIALQHISDSVLKRMRRNISSSGTRELLARIREEVPGIHLRTTLMTGFPGETDEDFGELMEFVDEQRFERMGAFSYCEVEGTYSALHYKDDVPENVKQSRLDMLMQRQQSISLELNESKVGKFFRTVIDRTEGGYYVGRTEFDSPEVDPEMLVDAVDGGLETGVFYDVKVIRAEEFDLYGTVENILTR